MLSMETLPIKPVKKSSSVMLEFMSRRAGRRVSIRVNLGRQKNFSEAVHQTQIPPQYFCLPADVLEAKY